MPAPPPRRLRFTQAMRLSGMPAFDRVYQAKARHNAGPITVFALPNGYPHHRLGLSVGRRVGNAVKRHRIKRLLREAFRLSQHDLQTGYDLVVVVYPHDIATLADYQSQLGGAIKSLDKLWRRRKKPDAD